MPTSSEHICHEDQQQLLSTSQHRPSRFAVHVQPLCTRYSFCDHASLTTASNVKQHSRHQAFEPLLSLARILETLALMALIGLRTRPFALDRVKSSTDAVSPRNGSLGVYLFTTMASISTETVSHAQQLHANGRVSSPAQPSFKHKPGKYDLEVSQYTQPEVHPNRATESHIGLP